jgi:hypothetical protein
MKLKTISLALLASTALVTGADARATKPGLYEIEGIQEICLQAAGTWYSPTFSGWGGTWQNVTNGVEASTIVRGNYASGAGNDSIAIKRGAAGWDEWRDDESYTNYADDVTWTKIGTCTDAGWHKLPHVNKSNPSQ